MSLIPIPGRRNDPETNRADGIRAVIFAVLVVTSIAVGTAGYSTNAAAVATPRTAVSGAPPVVVYQGESLDVSAVGRTTGGSIGPGSVTFVGIAGQADGEVEGEPNARSVDFSNYATGTYDVDNDRKPEIAVSEPRVTEVKLTLANGADVTNRRAPRDMAVTLQAKFNFDAADGVEIHVTDPRGVDVAPAVASSTRIDTSGGTVTLDFSDLDEGRYTIRVEGRNLDRATRSITLDIGSGARSVALDRTAVSQGERVRATVTGRSGETVHIRIRTEALVSGLGATDAAAQQVFESSGQVIDRRGSGAQNVVYAVLKLDDGGRGVAVIRTEHLRADQTTTVRLGLGSSPTSSQEDGVDLRVTRKAVAIRSAPETVSVGERFDVSGSAPQSRTVKAYARVDTTWEPLFENAGSGTYSEERVNADGSFTLTVSSGRVINLPGTYRIAVAADATPTYASNRALSQTEFSRLVSDSATVRTSAGQLSVSASTRTVAVNTGDTVTVVGTAIGQGDFAHLYVVPPRGGLAVADTVRIRNNEFSREIDVFTARGTYQIMVMTQGRDGRFKDGNTPPTVQQKRIRAGMDQSQVVAVLRDAYTGAGIDDQLVQLSVSASNPSVTLTAIGDADAVPRGPVTVRGTSNRQDGTPISVEVVDASGRAVASTETAVDGTSGTWFATLDLSDVPDGTYTVRATDDEVTAEHRIVVGTPTPTPTATPRATPTEQPTPTARPTPTPTAAPTPTPTPTPSPTPASTPTEARTPGQPGFGVLTALAALAAIFALGLRRTRSE